MRGAATDALESHDYVSLARDGIGLFAVDGEIVVAPEDVWLRSRRGGWWRWRAKGIALLLSLRDNAAQWTTRFRSERHSARRSLLTPLSCLRAIDVADAVAGWRSSQLTELWMWQLRFHSKIRYVTCRISSRCCRVLSPWRLKNFESIWTSTMTGEND